MKRRRKEVIFLFLTLFLVTACDAASEPQPTETETEQNPVSQTQDSGSQADESLPIGDYTLTEAFPALEFEDPLLLTHDGESNKVYVVEKTGRIKSFDNDSNVETAEVFVDLSSKVDAAGGEKGLLGLAFHPNYDENGYFYVNYTDESTTKVARYSKLDDAHEDDIDSEEIILEFDQPYANHNGGHLAFGPDDYLYIGTGDGGSGGDSENKAQNTANLLGKILRIDVDQTEEDHLYAIPEDNPFKGNREGDKEEIYAYGLRNPWKFSFDAERGLLLAADVGQDSIEEINIIENGGNYGWKIKEGSQEFKPVEPMPDDLIDSIWEYDHSVGQSITGGYVYDGQEIPSLAGYYIYGDFVAGKIWALGIDSDETMENHELLETDLLISSFGLDRAGELYIVDFNGKIYQLAEEN